MLIFGMLGHRSVVTPMNPAAKSVAEQGELLDNPTQYRRLVGKLNYLTLLAHISPFQLV